MGTRPDGHDDWVSVADALAQRPLVNEQTLKTWMQCRYISIQKLGLGGRAPALVRLSEIDAMLARLHKPIEAGPLAELQQ